MDSDAWLDPKGNIIKVGRCEHNNYASDTIEEEMGLEGMMNFIRDTEGISYPYQILHLRGWVRIKYNCNKKIKIYGDCTDLTKPMRNTMMPAMNPIQLIIAKKLCKENGISLQDAINDERFIK